MVKISDINDKLIKENEVTKIKHGFNEPLIINLPIHTLVFNDDFDNEIIFKNFTIKRIKFGYSFNREIKFPDSVEEIEFGDLFNKNVIYPKKLKKLTFGKHFNQSLNNLPNTLEFLSLGEDFRFGINIPRTVKSLEFCPEPFKEFSIQPFIRELTIDGIFNGSLSSLPALEKLTIRGQFNWEINNLPCSLRYLELGNYFNKDISIISQMPILRILILGDSFQGEIPRLPVSLVYLKIGYSYERNLDFRYHSIREVKVSDNYKGTLVLFPKSLMNAG